MLRRTMIAVLLLALPALAKPPKKQPAAPSAEAPATEPLIHYTKPTDDENKAAIAAAQDESLKVAGIVGVKFDVFQTDHFIVSTDWDPREDGFLKRNVELAYTAVARELDQSPKENVFVGKLPIFMFAHKNDFIKFSTDVDELDLPDHVAGYFAKRNDGWLHMAMWKPVIGENGGTLADAERDWAYTLTHEFTHAFMARYRTNVSLPRWLNEGLAEVVANSQFPHDWAPGYAKRMSPRKEVDDLFDDSHMPSGDMYPVMMTMVQSLIAEGPKKFLGYLNDIKEGTEPEKALEKAYNVDNPSLIAAWRKYIKNVKER